MNKIRDEYHIVGKNFLHLKTGRVYQVVNLAYHENDLEVVVIYHDESMVHWVRPLSEFMDGRFQQLAY